MDTLLTSGQVARGLGVSIPRVHRAVAAGVVTAERADSGRLTFSPDAIDELRGRWGWCPDIPGLGREETFVLAALSRRPLGLRSARAAARAAGVSATTASRCLGRLRARGFVMRRTVRVAEGRARDASVWAVAWGSRRWLGVATDVGRCVLPEADEPATSRVPRRLAHLFWNVDIDDLDPVRDAHYIADRILRSGDAQGLAWLARHVPHEAVAAAGRGRGLDSRRSALARVLAA